MRKYWEINSSTLDESIRIAHKQIQKYCDKRNLRPYRLDYYEGHSTEVYVGLMLEDGSGVDVADFINNNKGTLNGKNRAMATG